jgi:hypothetical protein
MLCDSNAILKANCNAHVINNCYKKGSDVSDIDMETVILKTCSFLIICQKQKLETSCQL